MDTNANDVITSNKIVEPKKIYYSYCKVQKVLYGFMETDVMCVRVVGLNSYKNLRSAYGSYYSCAKKSKLPIRVSTRKGELFLFRTDKEAKIKQLNMQDY